MGVFVSELSSPFGRLRQLIDDRPVQASGIALEPSEAAICLPADHKNATLSAHDALRIASEVGPVDQLVLMKVVSDAALDDLAVSEKIRRYPGHEKSANSIGMW